MEFVKINLKSRFIYIISALILVGCAGNKPIEQMPLEDRFQRGQEFLEKKKYHKAQQEFQIIVFTGSHTDLGDDAQFYLAESFFKNKEYLIAISEYERLTRKMKYSPFVEKSRWRICQSYVNESPKYYHDQGSTENALIKLQEFIDEYPNSEFRDKANEIIIELRTKLAEKLIKSAVLYTKLHAYDSAIITYQSLLDQYYDTKLADEAHVGIIKSYAALKDLTNAQKYYNDNESKISSEDLKKKAQQYINSIDLVENK